MTPTEKLVRWPNDPLVAICNINQRDPRGALRSIGFITEKFDKGIRLITTVRHGFDSTQRTLLLWQNGVPRPNILELISTPLFDPVNDIAFILARDTKDSPVITIKLEPSDPLFQNSVLYSGANCCNHVAGRFDIQILRQTPEEMDYVVFTKATELKRRNASKRDSRLIEKLRAEGLQCNRYFNMVSRPGHSGSPVWDEDLRLIGMIARGTDSRQNPNIGDYALVIPTGEIYLAKQRMAPRISSLLSKLGVTI